MPQGHHRHENQRDKRNTRLVQQVRRARENWVIAEDRPIPVIDIGEKRISEIIREVTADNQDAFQSAWAMVLEDHCKTEDDIRNYAIQAKSKEHIHKYPEISLQSSIRNDDSDKKQTIEDVISSPGIIADSPEECHTSRKRGTKLEFSASYARKQGLDNEILNALAKKFPGESVNTAVRMLLGLPTKPTKYWKQAELKYLKENYYDMNAETIALHLGRTIDAVRLKANELKMKKGRKHRRTPNGCYTKNDVINIFHFEKKRLVIFFDSDILHWREYKGAKIYHRDDIIEFIKKYPFEYRHELLEAGWRSYVPRYVWEWLPIEEAAKAINYSRKKIDTLIRRGDVPIKNYGKKVKYVRLEDINRILKIESETQPYRVIHKGDKTHYAYWFDDDLVIACNPKLKGVTKYSMKVLGYDPYTSGYPTCLKCLEMLDD